MAVITRIIATLTALVNLLLGSLGIIGTPGTDKNEKFRVTEYIVASRIQDKAALCSEDFDIITDVILFDCASFNQQGEIIYNEKEVAKATENLREVIGDRDVKIHINLLGPKALKDHGDWNENCLDQAEQHNIAFRSGKLEQNVADFVIGGGFDGVFFDYEYPMTLGNWLVFDEFLVRVDALLKDKILGLAVVDWNLMLTPGAYLAVDRYETMIYDIMDENGKHATYDHSIAVAKNYYKYLIPREKLDFGLPTYARPTDGDAYWYDWAGYYDKIDENGFYYDESIDKTFWFNSQEDFFKKTTFALDEGWGGMMIFRYKCDLPTTNENSLLLGVGDAIAQHNK